MELKDRPYVIVKIDRLLRDVLKHDCHRLDDGWLVNGSTATGAFLLSMLTPTLYPTARATRQDSDSMKVYLPVNDKTCHFYQNYWYTLRPEHLRQLEQYIDAQFRLRVGQWFLEGYRRGYRQKDIVKAIIAEYGLWASEDNFSLIKQMDYRQRRAVVNEIKQVIKIGVLEE